MLVGNVFTSGHQARTMSLNSSIEAQKKKTTRLRIKGLNGLGKKGIHDKFHLPLYRGTHRQDLHFPVITVPLPKHFPYATSNTLT
jgi:hypothetical protein